MKTKRKIVETRLICPQCGNIQKIFRLASKRKNFGHLKALWCFKCKQRINHIEIKDENISFEELKEYIQRSNNEK